MYGLGLFNFADKELTANIEDNGCLLATHDVGEEGRERLTISAIDVEAHVPLAVVNLVDLLGRELAFVSRGEIFPLEEHTWLIELRRCVRGHLDEPRAHLELTFGSRQQVGSLQLGEGLGHPPKEFISLVVVVFLREYLHALELASPSSVITDSRALSE